MIHSPNDTWKSSKWETEYADAESALGGKHLHDQLAHRGHMRLG